MAKVNEAAYERDVFDEAARLVGNGQNTETMRADLEDLYARKNMTPDSQKIQEVMLAQTSPNYSLTLYRGVYADEGVVEAVKDILREVYVYS